MSSMILVGLMAAGIIAVAGICWWLLRLRSNPNNFSDSEDSSDLDQPPSPVGRLQPYEVFISFRGEDTRNNFVSHLHSALIDRGIRTYFDELSLQKGQTIGPELVKAIEESSIAIVVLSSNYASSTWCLDELVKIMEWKNKFGLVVFPIFYHVDPSDVRKQKNSFSKAFKRHEVNFKGDAQKVKRWREALTQIADLAGEVIHEQNEALCVKAIGDKIFKKLPVEASDFRKSLVGIESRMERIKELMESKPEGVVFIGIWGMGGIGKTTTARAIFEDCKHKFEGSCFLKDVKESKNRIETLQNDLLSEVLKTKFEGSRDVVTGSSIIQKILRFKKVLIVIDDVDNKEQLNALANSCDWFGKGSIIVITTRDEHVINDYHIEKYDIHTLQEDEALRLFSLHAFKNNQPEKEFLDLSLDVVRYVGGLPLALQVLGCHLFRRDIGFWRSTLTNLKDVPNDEITSKLQISFDGLSVLHQNMFLDIACFCRQNRRSDVEKQLKALGYDPHEGIGVLAQKSLIHIGTSIGTSIIEMHDLLLEMGRYIVRKRSNWDIRRYSHLWDLNDIFEVLSNNIAPSQVERIHFCTPNWYGERQLVRRRDGYIIKSNLVWEVIFGNMNNLSFLDIRGDIFGGNYNNVNVSQPFSQYFHKLRWFSWDCYPAQSLPKTFKPINLVHLKMTAGLLTETPDFSHMPNLEVLYLSYSDKLVHIHPSLGSHKKIKHIHLEHCKELEVFPNIDGMESLEILDLSHTKLLSVPEIYGKLNSLRKLRLELAYLKIMPRFVSIEAVSVSCYGLVELQIVGTDIVKTPDFSRLPNLKKVDLSSSSELVHVHASLGVHKRIKYINLSRCSKLEEFPTIDDMISLERLNLSYTRLQSCPEMRGNVKRLMKLELDGTEIRTLPRSIELATNLETLTMWDCDYLVTLPIIFLGLKISSIKISSKSLKYFKENMDDESASQQSKQLIGSQGKMQLVLGNCVSLEEIPELLLSRLRCLLIENCPILTGWICVNLVDLLDKYQHLCNLIIDEQVPHDIPQAFSEWDSVLDILQRRGTPFQVRIPIRQIPSLFQYQFSRPIDNIMRDIKYWDRQIGCTLLHITSRVEEEFGAHVFNSRTLRWGLSLVYNDAKGNKCEVKSES